MRGNTKYQPVENQQLSSCQEVRYAREFKKADIAGGFHQKPKR